MRTVLKTSIAVLLVLTAIQSAQTREGAVEPLTIKSYLNSYLPEDEFLSQKEVDKKIAEEELVQARDYFQSDLNITVQNRNRSLEFPEFPTFDFDEKRTSLEGDYTQQFPIGLDATVKGTKYFNADESNLGTLDEEIELQMSQSLWRNAFGRETDLALASARDSLSVRKQDYGQELAKACTRGLELYVDAYHRQQSLKIHEQLKDVSKRALDLAKRAYDRRLFREIDFLAAKADFSDAKSRHLQAEREHRESLHALLEFATDKRQRQRLIPSLTLRGPSSFFASLSLPRSFKRNHNLAYLTEKKVIKQRQAELELQREQERSEIDLGVALASSKGQNDIGPSITDYEEQTVRAFLQVDWPVINNTRDANIRRAMLRRNRAEYQTRRVLKEQKQKYRQLELTLEELKGRLDLAKEKVELYQRQVEEALDLIRSGKIEFEEFSSYRNALLEERLSALNIKIEMWQRRVELAGTSESLKETCEEFL